MDRLKGWICGALVGLAGMAAATPCEAKTLWFSGISWTVRPNGIGGPGANTWCENNAFIDANGDLHLRITRSKNNKWCSAEVVSDMRFAYGTYQFQLKSRVDLLDRNVVLGLFNYPTSDVGADGTNEIDIEFARWGDANADKLNYTAWPVQASLGPSGNTFPLALTGNYSTHRFNWQPTFIRYQSTHGHFDDNRYPIADWTFAPTDYSKRIGHAAMPVHMNLWLFGTPSTRQTIEVIISQFKYTP
ncbi:glycoside hydrolase family 16 protein [Lysobacter tyrosinilyticus]